MVHSWNVLLYARTQGSGPPASPGARWEADGGSTLPRRHRNSRRGSQDEDHPPPLVRHMVRAMNIRLSRIEPRLARSRQPDQPSSSPTKTDSVPLMRTTRHDCRSKPNRLTKRSILRVEEGCEAVSDTEIQVTELDVERARLVKSLADRLGATPPVSVTKVAEVKLPTSSRAAATTSAAG